MVRQQWVITAPIAFLGALAGFVQTLPAQSAATQNRRPARPGSVVRERPEELISNALRSNPVTAPYVISTKWRQGAVELSGIVGTKQIHDVAVRTAIAYGIPFRDNLVIDTAATYQIAASGGMARPTGSPAPASVVASSYYVYPPPLFGRIDDPFFGFVPPLVSFPPWWKRDGQAAAGTPVAVDNQGPARVPGNPAPAPGSGWRPLDLAPAQGEVEVTVDASGQVFLRGVVASDVVRREIEEMARSVPGVTQVISQFQIKPRNGTDGGLNGSSGSGDVPPPPPEPVAPPPAGVPRQPAMVKPRPVPTPQPDAKPAATKGAAAVPSGTKNVAPPGVTSDNQELSQRVMQVIERSDALRLQAIKIRSDRDIITISGKVNTAYEAMLAFRAAQQTPGVREVIDVLEFSVPDEDHPNPLPRKARSEDLTPYLAAQIRRNLGDLARIDSLDVRGDVLKIQGTVVNEFDLDRVLAIVRSIPILHGFRLEATLSSK